jgi:ribosome recycling factor
MVSAYKEHFSKAIEYLKQDISSLRTGRATPAIVEDIMIEAYGMKQPLKALASISVLDAKTLAIEPWDKSVVLAVDTGLRLSDLGINPVNDGKMIRLPLPDLSQDRRQELIKVLHTKLENARIAVRKIREEARDDVDLNEESGSISEDQKYKFHEEIEKMTKETNESIKQVGEEKEQEILKV